VKKRETSIVTIGLIQMRCTRSQEENLQYAGKCIAEAAKRGAQIVCLPELFLSSYFCQVTTNKEAFERAEPVPGPTTEQLSALAAKSRIVLVGGSIFERVDKGRFFNTCPVIGPDGALLGIYRKTHIPEDLRYHEQHYFLPGDTGIRVFETRYGNAAPLICFDQWFPEAARIAALKGAEIIIYPTAIGNFIEDVLEEDLPADLSSEALLAGHSPAQPAGGFSDVWAKEEAPRRGAKEGDWQKAWEDIQRSHAIANSIYVAAVNRVGIEEKLAFFGGSFVSDPFGNVLVRAGDKEEVVVTECDLSKNEEMQEGWGFIRNRRPEMYREIVEKKK
jgi:predicted amidohydrolase